MKFKAAIIIGGVVMAGLVGFVLAVQPELDKIRVQRSTEEVMHVVLQGVSDFRKKHGRLPSDIDKNGKIGNPAFADTLLPLAEDDEARLFWKELALPYRTDGDAPYPELPLQGTYLVAGYLDGKPLKQGGATIKGNVLVWTAKFYTEGWRKDVRRYPLRPDDAAYAERKLESQAVDPKQGWVQAYGSADCFAADGNYNLENSGKDCGLIFRIFDQK